jgi:gliding motility-associated-like protein
LELSSAKSIPNGFPDQSYTVEAFWRPDSIFIDYDDSDPRLPKATAQIMNDSTVIHVRVVDEQHGCMILDSVRVDIFDPVDGVVLFEDSPGYRYDSITGSILATAGAQIVFNLDSNYWHTDKLEELVDSLVAGNKLNPNDYEPNSSHKHNVFAEENLEYIYVLQITEDGCSETDTIFFGVRPAIESDSLYTVFTPNGDGINDTWTIPYAHLYLDVEVEIFNRWGQLIYRKQGYGSSTDYEWDGKSMQTGKDLPIGTYFYVIKPNDGHTKPITGTVTILR